MDDKVRQIGRLENMTEKSGLLSVTGIIQFERITSEMVEKCYHIVQLRVFSCNIIYKGYIIYINIIYIIYIIYTIFIRLVNQYRNLT